MFEDEPVLFQENSEWVLHGKYTREEAFKIFKDHLDSYGKYENGVYKYQNFEIGKLRRNRVRYGCQGSDPDMRCCWWLEAREGKGAKDVWVVTVYRNKDPKTIYV